VALFLSESLHVLARQGRTEKFDALIHRLGASADSLLSDPDSHRTASKRDPKKRGSVRVIFSKELALSTILVWLVCFLSLLVVYCILNWLPTLVVGAGLPLQTALLAAGAINVGSIFGNVTIARLNDKGSSCIPTGVAYCIGALCIGIIGMATSSTTLMLSVCLAAGIFSVGAQMSITPIVARLYPAVARGAGIGWSFSVGRLGGLLGPVIAGFLISFGMGFQTLMVFMGVLSLISGLAVFALNMAGGLRAQEVVTGDRKNAN
jgi:AAHS family 4-hydroxybenzoate transporter-like MFS transporter